MDTTEQNWVTGDSALVTGGPLIATGDVRSLSKSSRAGVELLPADGSATLYPGFIPSAISRELFKALSAELNWHQENARLFGRTMPLPRLTAWHGAIPYSYSGVTLAPCPFTATLVHLQAGIWSIAPEMNCVLANLYRNGKDSMSWHADNETLWGDMPTICSVSLGGTRRFLFKHRRSGNQVAVELADGDVLVMRGASQDCWLHAVPKTAKPVAPRINLTFRCYHGDK